MPDHSPDHTLAEKALQTLPNRGQNTAQQNTQPHPFLVENSHCEEVDEAEYDHLVCSEAYYRGFLCFVDLC